VIAGALLFAAVLAGGLLALFERPAARTATDDTDVAAGEALYRANCLECHGERALGDGPLAASLPVKPPSLLEHLGHHTADQLVQLIRAGIPPAMPPPALTEDEIRIVVDYVWTLVPESQVEALRAMRDSMERIEGGAPGMPMPMPAASPSAPPADSGHDTHRMH
jgi:mono/diheme cytochrome c family protein